MKILIDFDDVLFNTKKMISKYGYYKNKEIFNAFAKYYFGYVEKNKKVYLKKKDLVKIFEKNGMNKKDIGVFEKKIEEQLKNYKSLLFKDSYVFLKKIGKKHSFIFSFGYSYFQNAKIKATGIDKYVSKTIVVFGKKSDEIGRIIGKYDENEKIIVLDDRAEILSEIKKRHKNIITILIRRKDGRYNDDILPCCDYSAKNLIEAAKIIEKQNNAV